jgi:hypothetical protein
MNDAWMLVSGLWFLDCHGLGFKAHGKRQKSKQSLLCVLGDLCGELESIEISFLGTRITRILKAAKFQISVEICKNLCPNLNQDRQQEGAI